MKRFAHILFRNRRMIPTAIFLFCVVLLFCGLAFLCPFLMDSINDSGGAFVRNKAWKLVHFVQFENLEKTQAQFHFSSSTELLLQSIANTFYDKTMSEIYRVNDDVGRHTFFSALLKTDPELLFSITSVSKTKQNALDDGFWYVLVSGYQDAPSNMVVAATRNIDLEVPCPESNSDRRIWFRPRTRFDTRLRDRGVLILKDGTIVTIGRPRKPFFGKEDFVTYTRPGKVIWASSCTESDRHSVCSYLSP